MDGGYLEPVNPRSGRPRPARDPFDGHAIVIDPLVPADAQRKLRGEIAIEADSAYPASRPVTGRYDASTRAYYGQGTRSPRAVPAARRREAPDTGRLIPFWTPDDQVPRTPAPPREPREKQVQVRSKDALAVRRSGIWAVVFLFGALIAAAAGSGGAMAVLLLITVIATVTGVKAALNAHRYGWHIQVSQPLPPPAYGIADWRVAYAESIYHRQYVVPDTDIWPTDRPIWDRATAAANRIYRAEVMHQQAIDAVQVRAAVPQQIWRIAEGLARVAQVRHGHQRILGRDNASAAPVPDTPAIATKVSRQENRLERGLKRVRDRVSRLEEFAGLLDQADAARRELRGLEALGEIDDMLNEMEAGAEESALDSAHAERLRMEVQAVIELVNEAIGRLSLPDEDERDGEEGAL